MKFGEPTPDRTVTGDGYMVGGGHNGPPPGKIGLMSASKEEKLHRASS